MPDGGDKEQGGFERHATTTPDDDVVALFMALAAIPSAAGQERGVADAVVAYLERLGIEAVEDDAGGDDPRAAGNLYVRVDPTAESGEPLLLCAHVDTVPPEGAIEPELADGVVRNRAGTILGADNKAAVAAMLVALRRIVTEGRPHAGLELLLTVREESGLDGVRHFDVTGLRAQLGFTYDHTGSIGEVVGSAPWVHNVTVDIVGRSAHAGINPEQGRSAIHAAARAIGAVQIGRVDDYTSVNVGTIGGGTATNVVPDRCIVGVEVRSRDRDKALEQVERIVEKFASVGAATNCEIDVRREEKARGYVLDPGGPGMRIADAALRASGFEPRLIHTNGGADANVLNGRGIACLNLSNGMALVHSPDEHISATDLHAMVNVTLALVEEALTI